MADAGDHPHRRRNPLTGEWILVSPQRQQRPWAGQLETPQPAVERRHEIGCHLCAGNTRTSGAVNPDYRGTFVFANDFPALLDQAQVSAAAAHPLFTQQPVRGISRVICFSPDHSLTLARMPPEEIAAVVDCWAAQVAELATQYRWIQVFENKGELMGCSNPHPHGQLWASSELPTEAEKEDRTQRTWFEQHGSALLLDYAAAEINAGVRVVDRNAHWLVVVPWWAAWPFETLLLPLAPVRHLDGLSPAQRAALATILKQLLVRYDNLFQCSFPYSMGWHGLTGQPGECAHWQLHAHFYPPLLRSAAVRKFMVGYEMLAEPQRDLTPETAAERLRACATRHYRET